MNLSKIKISKDGRITNLDAVFQLIIEILRSDSNFTVKDIYIEFSSLSSVLVSKKMMGYSYVESADKPKDGISEFEENVKKYSENIIEFILDKTPIYPHKDYLTVSKDKKYFVAGYPFISSYYSLGKTKKELKKIIEEYYGKDLDKIEISPVEEEIIKENKELKEWFISYDVSYEDFLRKVKENKKKLENLKLEDHYSIVNLLYDKYFFPDKKSVDSIFFGIPIIGVPVEGSKIMGQGGIFIYFTFDGDLEYGIGHIKKISKKIDYIIKNVIFNLLTAKSLALLKNVKQESIKSAVSAIMARNMSHNLGSHFISNTKNYFGTKADGETDAQRQREYRGIKHTLQYIQERMDFIATIVSSDKFPYGPVNLKSQIFDELTPDDLGDRHGKYTKNFLLDFIVFSESVSKKSDKNKINGFVEINPLNDKNKDDLIDENLKFTLIKNIFTEKDAFNLVKRLVENTDKLKNYLYKEAKKIRLTIITPKGYENDEQSEAKQVDHVISLNKELIQKEKSDLALKLELITKNKNEEIVKFDGSSGSTNDKKQIVSMVNIAIPGGILGRHSLFTIIENIIRNSAKHDKNSLNKKEGLKISIRINKDSIIVFDNKNNANEIKPLILEKLGKTRILDEQDSSIDKANKGLKEIIISALWLNNADVAEKLSELETKKGDDKINSLKEYLEVIMVDNNGDELEENSKEENLAYKIKIKQFEPIKFIKPKEANNYICYEDIKDIHADIIVAFENYKVLSRKESSLAGEELDGVIKSEDTPTLEKIFPRFFNISEDTDLDIPEDRDLSAIENDLKKHCSEIFEKILNKRYGEGVTSCNIDIVPDVLLDSNGDNEGYPTYSIHENDHFDENYKKDIKILFKNHLTNKEKSINTALTNYPNAKYIDSISGGDFTHTITQNFFLKERMNRLKVLESALCQIVIIDERIFKNYARGEELENKQNLESYDNYIEYESIFKKFLKARDAENSDLEELKYSLYDDTKSLVNLEYKEAGSITFEDLMSKVVDCDCEKKEPKAKSNENYHKFLNKKGLHIYNIDCQKNSLISPNGNEVSIDSDKKISVKPTFLSIHLSLIEKLVEQAAKEEEKKEGLAKSILEKIKNKFTKADEIFLTVHSGRGNLSKDLEDELKDVAFLNLSAIEASLSNSKYFISQLMNSSSYFGKGKINE